jgi:eukaryotic-like serine/threonine-protein kinase
VKFCTACGAEYGDEILFCQRDGTPLRAAESGKDLVGSVVAERYHIQRKLGEGGMGQVYLAEHVKMGRRCAIKIMAQSMMNDPDAISRFNREAANASRISHPNVCAIYDFGETTDGLIYLAMEFIEGQSLSGLLDEGGPMSLPRAAGIIAQCADALQAAHDLGIVHRDLKPDNIMVITSRGRDTVKVVDFGIAKATDPKASGQKVTRTGLVVGTPEYMSPEQLSGDTVDGRSDLYSLALVFYRMLTGKLPFEADSAQETMIKRLTDDPLPLSQARPDLRFPASLQAVISRALARTPPERFASAAEFGREVTASAGSATGMVDLDAGTQAVRPEDLKKALATVPATRIDPDVARISKEAKRVAEAGEAGAAGKADRADRADRADNYGKKSPVVPIAAAVLVVAAAGGAYAMRGSLFGGATPTAPTNLTSTGATPQPHDSASIVKPIGDTVPSRQSAETSSGTLLSHRDSVTPPKDPVRTGTSGTKPPVTPVNPPPDLGALKAQVLQFSEDLEFVDSDAKRAEGKQVAQKAWGTPALGDSVRAEAAAVMGSALLKENDRDGGRLWYQRAYDLNPKSVWKQILAGIN